MSCDQEEAFGGCLPPERDPFVVEARPIRRYASGATRDSALDKLEYARFFSPEVLESFAKYMHRHRTLSDGSLREPDNWKNGMDIQSLVDGLFRHVMDVWLIHVRGEAIRPETGEKVSLEDALNGVIFNAMAFQYERIKGRLQ
jgi:hypothetical protein